MGQPHSRGGSLCRRAGGRLVKATMAPFIVQYPSRVGFPWVEDSGKLGEELRRADAVVLTYACERPETLDRLSTFWLPELRRF
ncbi:hypothetical protein MLD38_035919 [Melastoma candidum]|uniref:Uncharacterized protein n=1 Tax=Melastoma candidum TaxID=119954 RepID=A0ACB9LHY6_9MYRT|nr:hypothetical protein MLD38_035919 [Melastoma candidum]